MQLGSRGLTKARVTSSIKEIRYILAGPHSIGDVLTDVTIPLHALRSTPRYAQARDAVRPWTTHLVGHSLGGAIVQALIEDFPRLRGRTYGSPALSWNPNPRIQAFRRFGDPVSITNRAVSSSLPFTWNPHSYSGF